MQQQQQQPRQPAPSSPSPTAGAGGRAATEEAAEGGRHHQQKSRRRHPRVNLVEVLPEELLIHIFLLLQDTDLARLTLVCRRTKALAEDRLLWKVLARKQGYYHPQDTRSDEAKESACSRHPAQETQQEAVINWKDWYCHRRVVDNDWARYLPQEQEEERDAEMPELPLEHKLPNDLSGVLCMDITAHFLATGGGSGLVQLYNLQNLQLLCSFQIKHETSFSMTQPVVCVRTCGNRLLASNAKAIYAFIIPDELLPPELLATIPPPHQHVSWSGGKKQLPYTADATFVLPIARVFYFSFTDQVLITGATSGTVTVWDMECNKVKKVIDNEHTSGIQDLQFFYHRGKAWCMTAGLDSTAKMWDFDGNVQRTFTREDTDAFFHGLTCGFVGNGMLAFGAYEDHKVFLYDIDTNESLAVLADGRNWSMDVHISEDGKRVANCTRNEVVIYYKPYPHQRTHWRLLLRIPFEGGHVTCVRMVESLLFVANASVVSIFDFGAWRRENEAADKKKANPRWGRKLFGSFSRKRNPTHK